jgi:ketosteroid isomerase-like protein
VPTHGSADAAANAALVRKLLDAWEQIDETDDATAIEFWQRFTTRDVVYHDDPGWSDASTHHGRESVRERFEHALRLTPGHGVTPVEVCGVEDRVLVMVAVDGDGPPSAAWVLRFEDGRVDEFRAFLDVEEARVEAGLG